MCRKKTNILIGRIKSARKHIEHLFEDQCANGNQTTNLPDDTLAACGQFIGDNARSIGQRGLHGIPSP